MRNLNALSAYPVIVNPTHYVGDEGWFSDTELPPDILAKIRERKRKEEAEEKRNLSCWRRKLTRRGSRRRLSTDRDRPRGKTSRQQRQSYS